MFSAEGEACQRFRDQGRLCKPVEFGYKAQVVEPVLTEGTPVAAEGADAGALGTTKRTDGSTQVTYAGHPFYCYAHEGKTRVLCHNVKQFGGLWLVLTPSGEAAA